MTRLPRIKGKEVIRALELFLKELLRDMPKYFQSGFSPSPMICLGI